MSVDLEGRIEFIEEILRVPDPPDDPHHVLEDVLKDLIKVQIIQLVRRNEILIQWLLTGREILSGVCLDGREDAAKYALQVTDNVKREITDNNAQVDAYRTRLAQIEKKLQGTPEA
jgi:hypothetical protein